MKIYNTLSRQKEELKPITKGTVKIYACGPTVYNLIHLGNARQICVFDTLRKYLEFKGLNVFYVQNFTDVDDKIIKKAKENGKTPSEISEKYIAEYFKDARGLGISDADIHPKVTETIDIIISLISDLIDKGYAYQSNGDVYFRTAKFSEYGKLSHMPLEELQAGASERVSDSNFKENAMDFALWKASKEGEPYWASPFGNGRPGWHIECSAMSKNYIGDTIDIHGGGSDLIFPHHENEIAQSECATGKPLANIWMHNGMLNIDNKKMSKSKNNFFLVRELSEIFGYESVKFMLVNSHYRSQMNYTEEVIRSAANSLTRLKNCADSLEISLDTVKETDNIEVQKIIKTRREQFITAMDDDLNSADGMAALFELVRDINTIILSENYSKRDIIGLKKLFDDINRVFGLLQNKEDEAIPEEVLELAQQRKLARKNKNFESADKIREKIAALGFSIEETRHGTVIKKI